MKFQEGGDGKLWITPQEHVSTKLSWQDRLLLKYNTKAQLLGNLKNTSSDMYVVKGKRVGDLKDISRENLISVKKENKGGKGEIMDEKSKGTYSIIMGVRIYEHIQGCVYLLHTL